MDNNIQGLLFLWKGTLSSNKLEVYVLLKLLKTLTKAPVTSYKIKWAVNDMLSNTEVDEAGIGRHIGCKRTFSKNPLIHMNREPRFWFT